MLGLKLNHVSKRGHWWKSVKVIWLDQRYEYNYLQVPIGGSVLHDNLHRRSRRLLIWIFRLFTEYRGVYIYIYIFVYIFKFNLELQHPIFCLIYTFRAGAFSNKRPRSMISNFGISYGLNVIKRAYSPKFIFPAAYFDIHILSTK